MICKRDDDGVNWSKTTAVVADALGMCNIAEMRWRKERKRLCCKYDVAKSSRNAIGLSHMIISMEYLPCTEYCTLQW